MQQLSPYIVAVALGWIAAQCIKYLLQSAKVRKMASIRELYKSGRMPSSHSAATVALLVVVGYLQGLNSAIFGVMFLFTCIVLYDAMMVRRSSGEQGLALTALLTGQKSKVPLPRVAMGHTPLEVAMGSLLGLLVGILTLLIMGLA